MTRRLKSLLMLACAVGLAALIGIAAAEIAVARDSVPGEATASTEPSPEPVPSPAAINLGQKLAAKGMTSGSPVLLRIFKAEAELELWMEKGGRFELFASYPICNWSGSLGPKLHEGDRQAPEGFYSVGIRQLHRQGRWPRSLDIGFPNLLDRANGRTGSYILIHGGCKSTGCFAMTNPLMEEIYTLSDQALRQGQPSIEVHVFPFRLSEANFALHKDSPWMGFWRSLKPGYDLFERTHVSPRVSVCNKAYVISEGAAAQDDMIATPVARPAETDTCDNNDTTPVVSAAPSDTRVARATPQVARTRVAASKPHARPQAAGRNTRKAYAAARRARVAAYAKRARRVRFAGSKRAH